MSTDYINYFELTATQNMWLVDPRSAFARFVASDAFIATAYRRRTPFVLSIESQKVYRYMFQNFTHFLETRRRDLLTVAAHEVYEFIISTGKSSIQRRYLRLLDRVFAHIKRHPSPSSEIIIGHQSQRFELKSQDKATRMLSHDTLEATLINVLDSHSMSADWRDARNAAIVAIMVGGGLRVSELRGLKVSEVSALMLDHTCMISLRDRDNKANTFVEHDTYVWPTVAHIVERYRQRLERLGIAKTYFFPATSKCGPMSRCSIFRATRSILAAARIPLGNARILRNTFAKSELLSGNTDENLMQKMGLFDQRTLDKFKETN